MSQDVASHLETLYRDGVTALKGAFSREWVDRMREDMMTAFCGAIQRPGGAVGRVRGVGTWRYTLRTFRGSSSSSRIPGLR
ncbi:MAG: hypothetical protein V7640_2706, partial [Betaproteobacteria bacterium]